MEQTTNTSVSSFTLNHDGKRYISFTESDLLNEGVPQSEIDKEKINHIHAERKNAYKLLSDPLYMEWQYDQTSESEQVWRDKVTEIKALHPLPV